jgi:ribosomal protein S18 acetylase RimI-like enzyme
MARDLNLVDTVPVPNTLSVRAIEEADVPLLEEFCRAHRAKDPDAARRVRECRLRGYPGFLATLGESLLGHFWWVDAQAHRARPHPRIQALALELDEGAVYLFDFYIAPPYRGRLLSRPFLAEVHAGLRQRGYRTATCDVLGENERARRAYRATGWREVATVRMRGLFSSVLICPGGLRRRDALWF